MGTSKFVFTRFLFTGLASQDRASEDSASELLFAKRWKDKGAFRLDAESGPSVPPPVFDSSTMFRQLSTFSGNDPFYFTCNSSGRNIGTCPNYQPESRRRITALRQKLPDWERRPGQRLVIPSLTTRSSSRREGSQSFLPSRQPSRGLFLCGGAASRP
jgi:hypothetical protein